MWPALTSMLDPGSDGKRRRPADSEVRSMNMGTQGHQVYTRSHTGGRYKGRRALKEP